MLFKPVILLVAFSLPSIVSAQLASGYPIGPSTSSDTKWATKICDVTKYGAVADLSTDLGPPLAAAFAACMDGGIGKWFFHGQAPNYLTCQVNIPLGDYAMATWVTLSGGTAWGINLEGVIYRTGYISSSHSKDTANGWSRTSGGHMIVSTFIGAHCRP
jgi:rhamnogalacturonan hydrolase